MLTTLRELPLLSFEDAQYYRLPQLNKAILVKEHSLHEDSPPGLGLVILEQIQTAWPLTAALTPFAASLV